MTVRPLVLALSLLVVGALGVGLGLTLATPAQAQTTPPATAVCEVIAISSQPDKKAAAWMNEQLAAGRTRFVTAASTFCAW